MRMSHKIGFFDLNFVNPFSGYTTPNSPFGGTLNELGEGGFFSTDAREIEGK